jgi:hypothetical protein
VIGAIAGAYCACERRKRLNAPALTASPSRTRAGSKSQP